jgi:hypothetical protein
MPQIQVQIQLNRTAYAATIALAQPPSSPPEKRVPEASWRMLVNGGQFPQNPLPQDIDSSTEPPERPRGQPLARLPAMQPKLAGRAGKMKRPRLRQAR